MILSIFIKFAEIFQLVEAPEASSSKAHLISGLKTNGYLLVYNKIIIKFKIINRSYMYEFYNFQKIQTSKS